MDPLIDFLSARTLIPCLGPELRAAAGLMGLGDVLAECARDPRLAGDLSLMHGPEPSRAFSRVTEVLTPVGLHQRVHRLLAGQPARIPKVAQALVRLSPALEFILTTNVDRTLEQAFGGYWPALAPMDVQSVHRRAVIKACGDGDGDGPALTYESLFGHPGEHRRKALDALLANKTLLFLGYSPDDEALRFLVERSTPVRGVALVQRDAGPATRGFFPAGVELLWLPQPWDDSAAEYLGGLADAYAKRTQVALPRSSEEVPLTGVKTRPFPGLEPYTAENHKFFLGREHDLDQLIERLRGLDGAGWCQIEGVSGVGKSSFVRAGLRPRFEAGDPFGREHRWLVAEVRPTYDPVGALVTALRGCLDRLAEWTAAGLVQEIMHDAQALCARVDDHLTPDQALLLVIDPLDEALTLCRSEQAEVFARALDYLLARTSRRVLLITTLRSDLAEMMSRLPALHERMRRTDPDFQRFRWALPSLSRAQLSAALVEAARRGGVEFQDGLVARLLTDAGLAEGATESIRVLPNLAAVLDRLWDRLGSGHVLRHDQYRGVDNALTEAADDVVRPLIQSHGEAAVRTVFLALVVVNEASSPVRRQLARGDLVERLEQYPGVQAEVLLGALTGRDPTRVRSGLRLVSTGADHVEIVHDALLRGWVRLSRWIDAYHEELLQTETLCQAARRWEFFGRPDDVTAHSAEANYLLDAVAVDALSRSYQTALRDSHAAIARREEQLSRQLNDLRDTLVPRFRHEPPPHDPLVAEVHAGLTFAIELQRPPTLERSVSMLKIRSQLERGAEALERLGAQSARGEYVEALRLAGRHLRQAPHDRAIVHENAVALLRLGDVELQLGIVGDACHHLQRARRAFDHLLPQCAERSREEAQLVTQVVEVAVLLADAEVDRGELVGAREALEAARSLVQTRAWAVSPRTFARVLTRLASVAIRRGEPGEARALLIEAQERAPDTGFVLDAQATLELQPGGSLASALDHLGRCVVLASEAIAREVGHHVQIIRPKLVDLVGIPLARELALRLHRYAEIQIRIDGPTSGRKHLDEAFVLFAEILRLAPSTRARRDLSRCLDQLGSVAHATGDHPRALEYFMVALGLDLDCVAADGNNLRSRHALAVARVRCGDAMLRLGRIDEARNHFQRGLEQCNLCSGYPPSMALLDELCRRLET